MWRWDPEHQRAFDGIKSVISSLPVLAYFNAKAEHTIQCDASKQGLGAVLLQDGQPVMYISRTLTETEQRYSNIEHELLAVVFALERLDHYTAGYRVKVESDHQPLTSIWKKPISSTSARIPQKWFTQGIMGQILESIRNETLQIQHQQQEHYSIVGSTGPS